MGKDRSSPALLELIQHQGRPTRVAPRPISVAPPPASTPPRAEKAPAVSAPASDVSGSTQRIVRLPIGYVYVALVAAVALVVVAYFVGAAQGRRWALNTAGPGEVDRSSSNESTQRPMQDNNNAPGGTGDRSAPGGASETTSNTAGGPGAGPGTTASRTPDVDTRQSGLNYIIIERFPRDEAWDVKEFLARNGIDVMVLPDNNPNLLQVVARQGFAGWASNDQAQAVDRRLEQLGRQWKDRESGSKDFSRRLARRQP